MSPEAERIFSDIMSLPEAERAALLDRVLATEHDEAEAAWSPTDDEVAELNRRTVEIDSGRVAPIPAADALRMIRGELDVPTDD